LTRLVALTTVLHYRADCDVMLLIRQCLPAYAYLLNLNRSADAQNSIAALQTITSSSLSSAIRLKIGTSYKIRSVQTRQLKSSRQV